MVMGVHLALRQDWQFAIDNGPNWWIRHDSLQGRTSDYRFPKFQV